LMSSSTQRGRPEFAGTPFLSHLDRFLVFMVEVRFRWERSFDRSYCHKKVGTDGNPFENYKRIVTVLLFSQLIIIF